MQFVDFCRRLGVRLEAGQEAFGRVAFDGSPITNLPDHLQPIAKAIFGDQFCAPAPAAASVLAAVCGARSGKSYLSALRLLQLAVTLPLTRLAPGEIAVGLIVAPDLRLAQQTLRYCKGAIDMLPQNLFPVLGETDSSITLGRGEKTVSVECLPATRGGGAVRGRSLVGAVLDEAAFFRDESYRINDAEVYRAIRPRILPGGQLLLVSTPWAKSGLLWELYRDNWGNPQSCVAAHAATNLMRSDNSILAQIAAERARDPENASREFDAIFGSSGAGRFFDDDLIDSCVEDLPLSVPPVQSTVFAGADLGFARNSSTLVVAYRVGEIYRLAAVEERQPRDGPLIPSVVCSDFAEILRKNNCTGVVVDQHYRLAFDEVLQRSSLTSWSAPTTKSTAYLLARTRMREGQVKIPKHRRLLSQLRKITAKKNAGGTITVTLPQDPDGSHCDLVESFVLALWHGAGDFVAPQAPQVGSQEWYAAEEAAMRKKLENRLVARRPGYLPGG